MSKTNKKSGSCLNNGSVLFIYAKETLAEGINNIIKDDKIIVQGKNLSSIDGVKKDLSDKRPAFVLIKTIRTAEPFEDTL